MIGPDQELGLKLPAPAITADDVARLVEVLRCAKQEDNGWMTAQEIAAVIGEGTTERDVRKIASAAAPAVVSYPGSRGYKLWQRCTVEEIYHCIETFESQGREMIKRALVYRQAYHRRFRGQPSGNDGQTQL